VEEYAQNEREMMLAGILRWKCQHGSLMLLSSRTNAHAKEQIWRQWRLFTINGVERSKTTIIFYWKSLFTIYNW